jgi:hypothetical protein
MQVLQLLVAVASLHHAGFLKVQRDVPGHTEPTPPGEVEGPDVDETTVISDEPVTPETVESTVEHQIEDSLRPTVVIGCVEDDCSEQTVTACHMLWKAKLKSCVDNYEAWSGFCGAPKFKDHITGYLRDCKQGCCSPVAQGTKVVLEKADVVVEGAEAPKGEETPETLKSLTPEQTEDIVKQIAEKTNGGKNPLTREEINEIAESVRAKAKRVEVEPEPEEK